MGEIIFSWSGECKAQKFRIICVPIVYFLVSIVYARLDWINIGNIFIFHFFFYIIIWVFSMINLCKYSQENNVFNFILIKTKTKYNFSTEDQLHFTLQNKIHSVVNKTILLLKKNSWKIQKIRPSKYNNSIWKLKFQIYMFKVWFDFTVSKK